MSLPCRLIPDYFLKRKGRSVKCQVLDELALRELWLAPEAWSVLEAVRENCHAGRSFPRLPIRE
jgi:hypothetical protein